jgi:hypothetical protein
LRCWRQELKGDFLSRNHDKCVPAVRVKTNKPSGRPTKKTAQSVARILKIARDGLPLKFAAQAGNIDFDTLSQWRAKDPVFARALEQAQLESVEKRWKTIAKAAEDRVLANGDVRPGDWKAVAWQLERSFPSEFSRPEIQLGVQINNSQTVNQTLVITAEMATQIQSRVERVDATIEKLFAARTAAQTGTNGDDIREVETSLVLGVIVMPAGPVPSHWWGQLVRGDNTREVERATASKIVRQILSDVFGQLQSQNTPVEFAPGAPILLRDVHARLESLCGHHGWAALTKRAEG